MADKYDIEYQKACCNEMLRLIMFSFGVLTSSIIMIIIVCECFELKKLSDFPELRKCEQI
jgi:hypothetical protein